MLHSFEVNYVTQVPRPERDAEHEAACNLRADEESSAQHGRIQYGVAQVRTCKDRVVEVCEIKICAREVCPVRSAP